MESRKNVRRVNLSFFVLSFAICLFFRLAFDTLMVCEKIVRNLQRNGQIYAGSIQLKKKLVDKFIEETESFKYLNCHGIKKKLLSRFAVVRLIEFWVLHREFVQR